MNRQMKENTGHATEEQRSKGGRKVKENIAGRRITVNLTEGDYQKLAQKMDHAGISCKSKYIYSCIFDKPLRVVRLDKAAMDFYMRLTTIHAQVKGVAANYNQVTRMILSTVSEKKALAFLYKLEQATGELSSLYRKAVEMTKEFERKYLK